MYEAGRAVLKFDLCQSSEKLTSSVLSGLVLTMKINCCEVLVESATTRTLVAVVTLKPKHFERWFDEMPLTRAGRKFLLAFENSVSIRVISVCCTHFLPPEPKTTGGRSES